MAPVLVVDDDPGIRSVISAVLEDEGFPVTTAANGREALSSISSEEPALVLLDLQMPVMSGWEVINTLREAQTTIPIVLMTAGFRAQAEAERCHADGFLPKPFNLDDLVQVVERFTGERTE